MAPHNSRLTVAINAASVARYHMPEVCTERLCSGFARYGATNHLQPAFEHRRETNEEMYDSFNGPDMFASFCQQAGIRLDKEDERDLLIVRVNLSEAHKAWNRLHDRVDQRRKEARANQVETCDGDCLLCEAPAIDCTVALPEQK